MRGAAGLQRVSNIVCCKRYNAQYLCGRYVRHMVHDARQHGLRAVVFNSRGTSDEPVTTPQFYSASYTGDMRAVVAAVLPPASIVRLAELCSCTLVRWLFLSCKSVLQECVYK